ncbi:MAG: hypothetical protein LKJ25_04370 [Clostridia bacterium]|jgi:hypothetical protein|nr:hypothetical protein [Clostridia bacterium]
MVGDDRMVLFKLIEDTKDYVRYEYFPNGEKESGVLRLDKKTGERIIENLSSIDNHKIFAYKAFSKILSYKENGIYEKNGMVAWY